MGIEGGSSNDEVQNQEINQSNNEQIEQNQAEHQRSGEALEGNSTIDNEGERKQIEGKDDAAESSEDESSQLDNDDSIENDTNQEVPAENEGISPEQQQLDNQDTIEGDTTASDGVSEDNQEIIDSLDTDDSIEDEDLSETDDTDGDEGSVESLDQDDSIEDDSNSDVESEDGNAEGDSLDSDDTIEDTEDADDSEESVEDTEDTDDSEKPVKDTEDSEEPVEDTEDTDDSEKPVEDTEDAEDSEESVEDTEDTEDTDDSEEPVEDTEDADDSEEPVEDTEDADDSEEPVEDTEDAEDSEEPVEDTEDTEDAEDSEEPVEDTEDTEDSEEPVEDTEDAEDSEEPVEDTEDTEDADDSEEPAEGTEVADDSDTNETDSPEGYHDIGEFNDALKDIYSDAGMSNQDKVDAAKECVDKLNHSDLSPEEKKQSVDAPSDARALKNPENSDWTEKTDDNPWPPLNIDFPDKMGLDYDKDISPIGRDEGGSQLPDTGYRYGGEGGYNFTCENSEGNVPTLDERSLPKEYVPEKDREVHLDNGRYCDAIDAISSYESDPAASLDSINGMIDDINGERGTDIQHLDSDELEALSDKYQQLQDTEFADVRDELGTDDRDYTKYGVHGYAKPMEDSSGDTICEGGADQFNTALPEYMLKRIGVEY